MTCQKMKMTCLKVMLTPEIYVDLFLKKYCQLHGTNKALTSFMWNFLTCEKVTRQQKSDKSTYRSNMTTWRSYKSKCICTPPYQRLWYSVFSSIFSLNFFFCIKQLLRDFPQIFPFIFILWLGKSDQFSNENSLYISD